jgi:hypothetical protein
VIAQFRAFVTTPECTMVLVAAIGIGAFSAAAGATPIAERERERERERESSVFCIETGESAAAAARATAAADPSSTLRVAGAAGKMASWTVSRYRRLKMIKEIKGEMKAEKAAKAE